jgi:hypothetical protein
MGGGVAETINTMNMPRINTRGRNVKDMTTVLLDQENDQGGRPSQSDYFASSEPSSQPSSRGP